MSKVEVDLNQLAAAVSAAILQFAAPTKEPLLKPECYTEEYEEKNRLTAENFHTTEADGKRKKKRGRPKKKKPEPVEDESDNTSTTPNDFTAPAKRSDFVIEHDSDKKVARRVPFKKKKRINQWQDDLTLATNAMYNDKGEKLKYPKHAEPRDPQIEQEYHCGVCNRKFVAFPSYIPPKIEGEQPIIRCYNCNTK